MTEFDPSLAAPYIEALAREAGVEVLISPGRKEDGGYVFFKHYDTAAVAAIVRKAVEAEREALLALAASKGWAMKNEDAFEDALRDVMNERAARVSRRG